MSTDRAIAEAQAAAKEEQERSRQRRAKQAEEIRQRAHLEETLSQSAKALMGSSESVEEERQAEVIRIIRDGVANEIENLVIEIKRDVELRHRQNRLSSHASKLAGDVLRLGTIFASRKRKLEEIEKTLGTLRGISKQGGSMPGRDTGLDDLSNGCREIKEQIAQLAAALTQRYHEFCQTIHADHRRELSLRETFEECLVYLEPLERSRLEIQVRNQLKTMDFDARIKAFDSMVNRMVVSIPPMRQRVVDHQIDDARDALQAGDIDLAIHCLHEAKHYIPDDIHILRLEAECYESQQDWLRAAGVRRKAVGLAQAEPMDAEGYIQVLERCEKPGLARAAAVAACARWKKTLSLWLRWGDLSWNQAQWEEAIQAYQGARAIDSADLRLLRRQGCALVEAERFEEGLALLREANRRNDANGHVYRYIGRALTGLGYTTEAVTAFRRAIELTPNEAKNYLGLSRVLILRGEYEEASEAARQALERTDDRVPALEALGDALNRLGDYNNAIVALHGIVADGSATVLGIETLATAYWRTAEYSKAEAVLLPALKQYPARENLRHLYGLVCLETGRIAQAGRYLNPGNA